MPPPRTLTCRQETLPGFRVQCAQNRETWPLSTPAVERVKGVAGLYLRMGEAIDAEANERVHAVATAILDTPPAGVTDVIPSYASLFIEYDESKTNERTLRDWLRGLQGRRSGNEAKEVVIPVRYDGQDLQQVAEHAKVTVEEVIKRHSSRSYRVYALGFTPGFPFMGEIDESLRMPRLATPRPRVEAHTVAIADGQTGIYPLASPGGWRLLGTALTPAYDPHRNQPFLVQPGDTVRFEAATDGRAPGAIEPLELLPPEPRHPSLRVVEAGLLDLVVDGGRSMVGRFGLARSGPLDSRSAQLANRLLANPPGAPLLEINGRGGTFEAVQDVVVAFAGWGVAPTVDGGSVEPFKVIAIKRGSVLSFPPQKRGARGYLALPGGIESRLFLGSASTDVRGLVGRPLRTSDLLGAASPRTVRPGHSFVPYGHPADSVTLGVVPGPQASDEALAVLSACSFTVNRADRMGVRFEGAQVPGTGVLSEGNPLGAVQITPAGQPLLMLNDRGTIGGYSKPAIVHPQELPKAGQLRAGDRVSFSLLEGARERR